MSYSHTRTSAAHDKLELAPNNHLTEQASPRMPNAKEAELGLLGSLRGELRTVPAALEAARGAAAEGWRR